MKKFIYMQSRAIIKRNINFCFGLIFLISNFFSFNSFAIFVEEKINNQALEQRAIALFSEVRCLVCQGQMIDSSDTQFSFEMRKYIRKKIVDGDSDDKIKKDLSDEFGSDVLSSNIEQKHKKILISLIIIFAVILFFKCLSLCIPKDNKIKLQNNSQK